MNQPSRTDGKTEYMTDFINIEMIECPFTG